eukprot:m51a1_g2521 hypothetical protein (261) ;mRNA; r:220058-221635
MNMDVDCDPAPTMPLAAYAPSMALSTNKVFLASPFKVTVSVGVAWMTEHGVTAEEMWASGFRATLHLEGRDVGPPLEACRRCCRTKAANVRLGVADVGAALCAEASREGEAQFVFDHCRSCPTTTQDCQAPPFTLSRPSATTPTVLPSSQLPQVSIDALVAAQQILHSSPGLLATEPQLLAPRPLHYENPALLLDSEAPQQTPPPPPDRARIMEQLRQIEEMQLARLVQVRLLKERLLSSAGRGDATGGSATLGFPGDQK